MTAKAPIRLSCLNSPEIPVGEKIKLRIRFENVDDALYGKCSKLEGDIPFILPQGSFPVSNYLRMTWAEQEKILETFVLRMQHLHENLDEEELHEKFLGWVIISIMSAPTSEVGTEIFDCCLDLCAASFRGDDVMDDEGDLGDYGMGTEFIFKRYAVWKKILDGEYESLTEIGRFLPAVEAPMEVVISRLQKVEELIPGMRQNVVHFLRSSFTSLQTLPLAYKENGENLSEEGMKTLRGYDAGGQALIELLALCKGVSVPEHIRQSLLFTMLLDGVRLSAGLLNDILGLQKDINNKATLVNVILRRVVREGVSLDVAFQETLHLLQSVGNDMGILSRKLLEAFPEEEGLAHYVRLLTNLYDGQIYGYLLLSQLKSRYGSIAMEVLAVNN